MSEQTKKWVEYPYKKDYISNANVVHWANLEKPDQGNAEFNVKPNHQITIKLSDKDRLKIQEIATVCGASKGVSGFREKLDDTGKPTGEWLLTCKTSSFVNQGVNKYPEVYDEKGNKITDQISRGDEVTVYATPGLVKARKTLSFYLKKVVLNKKRVITNTDTSVDVPV